MKRHENLRSPLCPGLYSGSQPTTKDGAHADQILLTVKRPEVLTRRSFCDPLPRPFKVALPLECKVQVACQSPRLAYQTRVSPFRSAGEENEPLPEPMSRVSGRIFRLRITRTLIATAPLLPSFPFPAACPPKSPPGRYIFPSSHWLLSYPHWSPFLLPRHFYNHSGKSRIDNFRGADSSR